MSLCHTKFANGTTEVLDGRAACQHATVASKPNANFFGCLSSPDLKQSCEMWNNKLCTTRTKKQRSLPKNFQSHWTINPFFAILKMGSQNQNVATFLCWKLPVSWTSACAGTPTSQSKLAGRRVPVLLWCLACYLSRAVGTARLCHWPRCQCTTKASIMGAFFHEEVWNHGRQHYRLQLECPYFPVLLPHDHPKDCPSTGYQGMASMLLLISTLLFIYQFVPFHSFDRSSGPTDCCLMMGRLPKLLLTALIFGQPSTCLLPRQDTPTSSRGLGWDMRWPLVSQLATLSISTVLSGVVLGQISVLPAHTFIQFYLMVSCTLRIAVILINLRPVSLKMKFFLRKEEEWWLWWHVTRLLTAASSSGQFFMINSVTQKTFMRISSQLLLWLHN